MIDPDSLCIQPGKAVWTIYVDAVCINFDGNAFDATILAMGAALSNSEHIPSLQAFLTSTNAGSTATKGNMG
jgi:exosome complex RNA-binding protein Rrp42 (RNase PH superfamily)